MSHFLQESLQYLKNVVVHFMLRCVAFKGEGNETVRLFIVYLHSIFEDTHL